MKVSALIAYLARCPDYADVVVRTVEGGEVCLTVDLTDVEPCEGGVLLIGNLDNVLDLPA